MADQEIGQKKQNPVTRYYVFMSLVIVMIVIIVGYVISSYLAG